MSDEIINSPYIYPYGKCECGTETTFKTTENSREWHSIWCPMYVVPKHKLEQELEAMEKSMGIIKKKEDIW